MQKTLTQSVKDQAARLREYLNKHDVPLSSSLALESVCRAVYNRPWNVVQAMEPRSKTSAAEAPELSAVCFQYTGARGKEALAMVARRWDVTTQTIESVNINQVLHQSSDEEILALFQTPRQEPWLHLTGRRWAHPSEGSGALVFSGTEERDDFAIWVAAFRPHLLLSYLSYRYIAGPKELLKQFTGVYVVEIAGGEEGWQVTSPRDTSSLTPGVDLRALSRRAFDSQALAEEALCRALLGGLTSSASKARWIREDLATLDVVFGSGVAEEVPTLTKVQGRQCAETGAPLVLRDAKPLSADELARITDNGAHYVDIVLQVDMNELLHGLDSFCDHLSERVTGSTADLEDIGYEAAPADLELPKPSQNHIWLQVIASWVPMEANGEDADEDTTSAV